MCQYGGCTAPMRDGYFISPPTTTIGCSAPHHHLETWTICLKYFRIMHTIGTSKASIPIAANVSVITTLSIMNAMLYGQKALESGGNPESSESREGGLL